MSTDGNTTEPDGVRVTQGGNLVANSSNPSTITACKAIVAHENDPPPDPTPVGPDVVAGWTADPSTVRTWAGVFVPAAESTTGADTTTYLVNDLVTDPPDWRSVLQAKGVIPPGSTSPTPTPTPTSPTPTPTPTGGGPTKDPN